MQPLWKTVLRDRKKLKTELPCDPVIPLLGIYPKKTKTQITKDILTAMITTTLFITNRIKTTKVPINR